MANLATRSDTDGGVANGLLRTLTDDQGCCGAARRSGFSPRALSEDARTHLVRASTALYRSSCNDLVERQSNKDIYVLPPRINGFHPIITGVVLGWEIRDATYQHRLLKTDAAPARQQN